jgi:hypothetical protein
MTQFWQCCKRTGLPEKDSLALLGFHPFARSWAEPQAAEQRSPDDQPHFSNAFFRSAGESGLHTPALGLSGLSLIRRACRQRTQSCTGSEVIGASLMQSVTGHWQQMQRTQLRELQCREVLDVGGNGMPSLLNDPALRALAQGWADNADLYTEVRQPGCLC